MDKRLFSALSLSRELAVCFWMGRTCVRLPFPLPKSEEPRKCLRPPVSSAYSPPRENFRGCLSGTHKGPHRDTQRQQDPARVGGTQDTGVACRHSAGEKRLSASQASGPALRGFTWACKNNFPCRNLPQTRDSWTWSSGADFCFKFHGGLGHPLTDRRGD